MAVFVRPQLHLLARLAALAIVLLAVPRSARACFRIGALALQGYPRDGAEDVPLDVLPVYQLTLGEFSAGNVFPPDSGLRISLDGGVAHLPDGGAFAALPSYQKPEATLSYEGGSVALTVRHLGNYFEIVPDALLWPRTLYTLEVRWQDSEDPNSLSSRGPLVERRGTVQFRTGDAPFAGDMSAPVVFATQVVGRVSSCDAPPRSVCFSLPDDEALYQVQFQGDSYLRLARGSFFSSPYPNAEDIPDCVTIRHRAPNGTLGEPARNCRGERMRVDLDELHDPDSIAGLYCKSDGLYLLDRPVAELFEERRAQQQNAREDEHPREDENDEITAEEDDAPRPRAESSCSVAPGSAGHAYALFGAFAVLGTSQALRRQRQRG